MTVLLSATTGDLPIRLGRPDGAPWIRADRLLEPGTPVLEERLRDFGHHISAPNLAVAASMLLEAYAGLLAGVGFGCLLGAGVGPDLAAGNVSLRFGPSGVPDQVALHKGWGVPPADGDRPAGPVRRQAALVPPATGDRPGGPGRYEAALGRLAEGLLGAHLAILVARLAELRVRRGPRALWGLVANGCANALVEAACAAGHRPERVRALLEAFFALPGSPPAGRLPGPPRLLEVAVGGGTRLLRKRVTCCLFRALPGREPCATCPVFPDGQAVERAAARLRAT
jgi:Ferric iron reductase FhuF-like transporter